MEPAVDAASDAENAVQSDAVVDKFGPDLFCRRLRENIRDITSTSTEAQAASVLNVLLLGPTGAGKSSLIYTWWRALTDTKDTKSEFFENHVHGSLLQRLNVGWSLDTSGELSSQTSAVLAAQAKHGTTAFNAYEIQSEDAEKGSMGIVLHDSKGQNFYSREEVTLAEQLLQGMLKPGSNEDERHFRYWFMLGQFGFFSTASLATSPHVVVLVFDVSLRSFKNMIVETEAGERNELLQCYEKILQRATKHGHDVYIVMTHADQVSAETFEDLDISEAEGGDFKQRSEEPTSNLLQNLRSRLSTIFCAVVPNSVPEEHIFLVENYRMDKHDPTSEIDFAVLECFELVVASAARFVAENVQPKSSPSCSMS